MPRERWKPIYGYTGLYEVSSLGRVRSLRENGNHKILKPSENKDGYLRVGLVDKNGKRRYHFMQRLVCRTFKGSAPSKSHEVAHKDGNRTNNKSSNLRWSTKIQNARDRRRHGNSGEGEGNASAKLRATDVRRIRRLYDQGWGASELAREYDVSHVQILNIAKYLRWTHIE